MSNGITGKTALITGASRGIGAATARLFAQRGAAHLILHYGAYADGVDAIASEFPDVRIDTVGADLTTDAGITALTARVAELAPAVDILINNAGHLVERVKLADFTIELYDRVMNLNAKSVYFLAQAVTPGMIARGGGHIVNLSSIAARNGGGPGATIYAASKAAVACMTKGLAKELAPSGIRVNAVSPGTVDNYFHEKYSTAQMLANVVAQTPAGRLQTNEEIAEVIAFLMTDGASGIIGQTIEINGGMYLV